ERVVRAVTDDGPAVVLALLDEVDLVAALRAVLGLPERARGGGERETLRIAVAPAPDLGQRALPSAERIGLRNRAVVVQPHDLALAAAQVLRRMALEIRIHRAIGPPREQARHAVAHRHVELAVRAERDARAEVTRRVVPRLG